MLQEIATVVIGGGVACAWIFHSIASHLDDSPNKSALDNVSVKLDASADPSPASRWAVRGNIAIAFTAISTVGFAIALNFVP